MRDVIGLFTRGVIRDDGDSAPDYFTMIPSVEVITGPLGVKTVESRRSCVTTGSIAAPMGPAQGMGYGTHAGAFVPGPGANAMSVYLDGVPWRDGLDRIQVSWIEAIEVYVGSQVPAQYLSRGGSCGVILIWSK